MAKKITVASYDIDIAPILRTIQELKNNLRGKEVLWKRIILLLQL